MPKHFIFDLGNVLVDFDINNVLSHLLKAAGPGSGLSGLKLQDTARVREVETGVITDEEYLAHIRAVTGADFSMEQLIDAWRFAFRLNPAGNEIFQQLREQGHPVHFLSNIAWHNVEAVRRNWPDFFERGTENFFSYELGYHKPDEQIYRAVLEHLNATPEECFFLDDRPENIAGARAVGFDAHVFSPENMPVVREALAHFIG
jgi:putative hydrolase of the HAD superfamily